MKLPDRGLEAAGARCRIEYAAVQVRAECQEVDDRKDGKSARNNCDRAITRETRLELADYRSASSLFKFRLVIAPAKFA